jgi:hypothetical protein
MAGSEAVKNKLFFTIVVLIKGNILTGFSHYDWIT